jgi:hypothetical protein
VICAGLLVPIAWTAALESASASRPTYQRCGALPDDARRLACYDAVFCTTLVAWRKEPSRLPDKEFRVAELEGPTRGPDPVQERCRAAGRW